MGLCRKLFLLLAVIFFLPQTVCFADSQVRVLVLRNAGSFSLKINGNYSIKDPVKNEVFHSGSGLYTTVTAADRSIFLGDKKFASRVLIVPQEPDAVTIDGRRFRGDILLIRDQGGISVINYVLLEDYIRGVLYHEVSHYWPDEVLKAQSIITRTYALYQMKQNKSKDFDLTSDIYSQVYGGRTSERYRLDRAAAATAGVVLIYKDQLFPAFFHASCGGHTEDAGNVWNLDMPALKGVDCPYCKESPHFNWHYVAALDDIGQKMNSSGISISAIKDITLRGRNESGRVKDVVIIPAKQGSAEINISAKDFRNLLGPNVIKSVNFTVNLAGSDAVFEGFGWGHGVGFCQWGGYFLAKQGNNCEQILKYYYPGVEITDIAVIARRPKADEAISKP